MDHIIVGTCCFDQVTGGQGVIMNIAECTGTRDTVGSSGQGVVMDLEEGTSTIGSDAVWSSRYKIVRNDSACHAETGDIIMCTGSTKLVANDHTTPTINLNII